MVQLVVMMMDDYKISDNFQGGAGCKKISPHRSHPANGVGPADVKGDHSKDWGDPGMQHKTKDKYDD